MEIALPNWKALNESWYMYREQILLISMSYCIML